MTLRRVLMGTALALPLLFGAPSVARADPVSTAIITTLGFTATAGAVAATTSFLVNTALFAASTFATKLMGKGKANVAERQASITTLSLGEVPRAAVIGMTCIGGSLVDIWNWGGQYGTDNVTRCIALADHACEGLYGYYVDDVFYRYYGPGVQAGFNGTLTIDYRNATPAGHAPPAMATAAGWAAADRMTAMTHVWVTTKFDDKVWTQGHPRFRWVLHGLNCFDPRNGDVWADRSTHSFTRNPILQRYAITRGVYAEGRQGQAQHLLIGRGLSEVEAPPERIIAAANLCDENVDGLSRYYADGEIGADMDFIDVEQMFAGAVAGVIVQREGGVEIEPGQAKATVATIRDGDLVPGEPVTFSRFLPDSDGGRINTVVPRHPDPAQNYADHSGPVRRDLADIAADGGPREMTLSLPLVTGPAVADRNAEIARRLARLERRATIVLPPNYAWLEEGDWIAWQSDRRHEGATVRYRIESWSLDEKWRMKLTLREIASSVFGVADPIEDTALPPPPPVPVDALSLGGVGAEAITLPGETSIMPAVRFTWDTPVDAAVRAIRAEVRAVGSGDVATTRTDDFAAGAMVMSNGVPADAQIEARLVPIGDPSRPVLAGAWVTLSTVPLAADIAPDSPIWGQLRDNANALLQNAIDDLRGLFDEEGSREEFIRDILDRLNLGFELDPVNRTALVRTDTTFEGVGPGGIPETLVQTTTRLTAVDAVNAAATAQVLIDAKAYTNAYKSEASLTFATQAALGSAVATTVLQLQSYADNKVATATANLVTNAALAGSLATAKGQWESYATAEAARAIIGLDTVAAREGALALARGQWESFATNAAASATIGLVTGAALAGSLATAKGQWESYATAAAASATVGLDTVAAREGAIAATILSLQSYTNNAVTTSAATLATQTSLNGVSAVASLALSTANGNEAVAALWTDVGGALTGLRINGVNRSVWIKAAQIVFGDNTTFDDPTDTLTTTIGGLKRVIAWGAPFGAASNLLEWFGPTSVPFANLAASNGHNGRMTTPPYTFDNTPVANPITIRTLSGAAGANSASATATVNPGAYLKLSGQLGGGSLNVDGTWFGQIVLTEETAAGTTTHPPVPITATSGGLLLPNGSFSVDTHTNFAHSAFAGRSGAVTYRITVSRTGGADFVNGASIGGLIEIITPT